MGGFGEAFGVLVLLAAALSMVGFPIYFWMKDRVRRGLSPGVPVGVLAFLVFTAVVFILSWIVASLLVSSRIR